MNVLVVGGAGYIGSHVVLDLLARGHQVTVFDDLSSGREENLQEAATFIKGSMLNKDDLDGLFHNASFDAVVHLAALKAAGDSMNEPERYTRHNLRGTLELINRIVEAGIDKFIFSSTAAVYGDPQYQPIDEDHPINPTNFYGFTKLQIERQLAWFSKLRGLKYACLRYFNAAGYDPDKRVMGLEINPKNLIPIVMEVAMGVREKLVVFGEDYDTADGTCIRDYVHVNDLADGHSRALDYLAETGKNLTVNLGSETGLSVKDVIKSSEKVIGQAIPHEFGPRRAGDPPSLVASSKKAQEILGWKATHSGLDDMIASAWEVYRANG